MQRRIFLQSKYEGAVPSIHIRLISFLRQSMSMQLLYVELSNPMTVVIFMKKSSIAIAPIQLPTMTSLFPYLVMITFTTTMPQSATPLQYGYSGLTNPSSSQRSPINLQ